MRKILPLIFCIFCYSLALAETNEYIVKIKNIDKFEKESAKILSSGAAFRKAINFLDAKSSEPTTLSGNPAFSDLKTYYVLRVDELNEGRVLTELSKSNQVESITPNYKYKLHTQDVPNDERYNEQWSLEQIRAAGAWKYASGEGIIVGVIDTGIDYAHLDLAPNLWINSKEDLNGNGRYDPWQSTEFRNGVSGDINGIDDDGNGFIDDVIGFDFVNQSIANLGDWNMPDGDPYDEYDHGTAVASVIAAARDNEIGIAGLAYNAKIMSVRVFDITGNADADDIAAGIVYAALNGAKVLNFSFGEVYSSPIVHSAVKFAHSLGVIMVASSGNENTDAKHYPSDYPEVISVGASTKDGTRWAYSNYGSNLCLIAPGSLVLSAVPLGTYRLKSGTSLSAPFVSAAVAMLLEKNPNLRLNDVKSILSATAKSVNPDGWDYFTGAGILDVQSALENIIAGDYKISSPKFEETFNRSKVKSIYIVGSTIAPMFDSYSILVGKGRNPSKFDTIISNVKTATLDDTLSIFNIENLADTSYTIALRIRLKSGKILESRSSIIVYSESNPFAIDEVKILDAIRDDKKTLFVNFTTNYDSRSELHYRPLGSNESYKVISDYAEYSRTHQYLIESGFEYNVLYEARLVAIIQRKDTAEFNFTFQINDVNFPKYSFIKKSYELPRAYIFPQVIDFNSNGNPNVFFNDLTYLTIYKAMFAEFQNGEFKALDTMKRTAIVAGIGDYNGDGITDILSYGNGQTYVTQQTEDNPSPFANEIFKSTSSNFWAEHFYDIDGDGRTDIIAHNDSSFFVYSHKGNKDVLLAQALLPKEYRKSGVWSGSAVGDFNGNGRVNLYHSNNNGHSFIFEFDGSNFELIYANTEQSAAENQYITSGDFDGDGIPEIIHGCYSVTPKRNDASSGLWSFKLIKYDAEKGFFVADSIFIYGIRAGVVPRLNASYRNGVAAADIDGKQGDELVISAMPNLYVFKWNKEQAKFKPIWYYPAAFANSVWAYDFDKNGKKEIGFATFGVTEFWEYNVAQKLAEPRLHGYALDKNTVKLEWNSVDGADEFECFMLNEDSTNLIPILSTNDYFAIINDLSAGKNYSFFVIAKSKLNPNLQSNLSNRVDIFTNEVGIAVRVEVVSSKQLIAYYSVPLKFSDVEPSLFKVNSSSGEVLSVKSAICSNNKIVLTLYDDLESGNYAISFGSFEDFYGNFTHSNELDFIYSQERIDELFLTRLTYYSNTFLQVEFSEEPDSSALDIQNYDIQPYGEILQIGEVPNNARAFEIALSSKFRLAPKGKNYYLTAKNISSASGKPMTKGAGSTLGFVVAADNLSKVHIYPNPIRLSEQPDIYIAGLTRRAIVKILTLDGEVLTTLSESDGNGGTYWNGTDKLGNYLAPGVYIIKVENPDNSNYDFELKKFMVVP